MRVVCNLLFYVCEVVSEPKSVQCQPSAVPSLSWCYFGKACVPSSSCWSPGFTAKVFYFHAFCKLVHSYLQCLAIFWQMVHADIPGVYSEGNSPVQLYCIHFKLLNIGNK